MVGRSLPLALRIALRARSASGLLDALGLGYDLPVGQSVYAIDGFPDDDLLWRIEWLGGVGYNTSVPSEPQIDVSLAHAPQGREEPAQRASTLLSSREENGRPRHRTVLPGSNLSEAAIGVASTHSGFRAEPSAADYSGAQRNSPPFVNSAERFANNSASDKHL